MLSLVELVCDEALEAFEGLHGRLPRIEVLLVHPLFRVFDAVPGALDGSDRTIDESDHEAEHDRHHEDHYVGKLQHEEAKGRARLEPRAKPVDVGKDCGVCTRIRIGERIAECRVEGRREPGGIIRGGEEARRERREQQGVEFRSSRMCCTHGWQTTRRSRGGRARGSSFGRCGVRASTRIW